MKEIGRNDPCLCGSGKKFKKCHLGREYDLVLDRPGDISIEEVGRRICALPQVRYGKSGVVSQSIDLHELTGKRTGVKFVDLQAYARLGFLGGGRRREAREGEGGGIFINPYKTAKEDPDNLYLAISEDIDDSTLIHEIAHVLVYLVDYAHSPGTLEAMSLEYDIPVAHLEHTQEFGHWLDYLQTKMDVQLDADDAIIRYLYEQGLLIQGRDIQEGNGLILRVKSERIFRSLNEKSEEIEQLVKSLPGYIGSRLPQA